MIINILPVLPDPLVCKCSAQTAKDVFSFLNSEVATNIQL